MANKNITLEEMLKIRPVSANRAKKIREAMIAESRAFRLAEFRKSLDFTQVEMAEILGVDQSNVSRLERGNFSTTEIGTLQAYIEALGGRLEIRAIIGRNSLRLVDSDPQVGR
jgi:predicted transcriptional regulator